VYLLAIEAKERRCRGVDVVDILGATRAGTARGYWITGPDRIRRREPVGDRPGRRSARQQRGCPALYAMYLTSLT